MYPALSNRYVGMLKSGASARGTSLLRIVPKAAVKATTTSKTLSMDPAYPRNNVAVGTLSYWMERIDVEVSENAWVRVIVTKS